VRKKSDIGSHARKRSDAGSHVRRRSDASRLVYKSQGQHRRNQRMQTRTTRGVDFVVFAKTDEQSC
jgi:hypothetical protein